MEPSPFLDTLQINTGMSDVSHDVILDDPRILREGAWDHEARADKTCPWNKLSYVERISQIPFCNGWIKLRYPFFPGDFK